MWIELSLFSACSKSASQILTKKLHDVDTLAIAAYSHVYAALIILPLIFYTSIPVNSDFLVPASISVALNVLGIILLISAIKHSEISRAIPFLSLTPVFTIYLAYILRGEELSGCSTSGICLVVFGALGIEARSFNDFIKLGGRRALGNNGTLLVIFVALIYSVSSVYDKTATLASSPLAYVWFSLETRGLILLFMLGVYVVFFAKPGNRAGTGKAELVILFFIGMSYFFEAIFQMNALTTGNVAEVLAVKRLSILITSVAGFLMFRETFTKYRLTGAVTMVAGAMIIYLTQ